ncbi:MAG TPA: nucleoside hydrolase [Candidatus Hydrogenedentes bacterium]|nr:nucleoside hydrolase [Candidatus Hydrogenedentota bacterium]
MSALWMAGPVCVLLAAQPVPVVLDTDLGSDIDDTWALCMLLGCPQVDVKLVVTAFDDTDAKTRLVAKLLDRLGRTDIPLGKGIKTSDRELNQAGWLGDYSLDDYPGALHEDGIQAMVDTINATKPPVQLVVIGPQTNIPAALKRDPSIAEKARLVSMAGSVYKGYNGQDGRSAEWNVRADVAAARAVFDASWEIVMAPLDSCGILRLTGERFARVAASSNPLAKAVMENYVAWVHRKRYPEGESSVLFDTVAAYLAFDEKHFTMETIRLSIDDDGNTVPDENGRPVRCAMDWADRGAFEELLVECLTREGG